jgi:amidohydrolase
MRQRGVRGYSAEVEGDERMGVMWKENLLEALRREEETIGEVCRTIYGFREVMFEERLSVSYLADLLEIRGFRVSRTAAGLETAFVAELHLGKGGPRVGLLAEYDALPGLGHACGHNLIAASAVGAALALAALKEEVAGTVVVCGTPAEEGGGGKVIMARAGLFDDLAGALYFHPSVRDDLYGSTLGCRMYKAGFRGREAHVQMNPQEGRNALTGLVRAMAALDLARPGLPEMSRMGYVVTEGGKNPILVPSSARGEFFLSAVEDKGCDLLQDRLESALREAAEATGTHVDLTKVMDYPSVRLNGALTDALGRTMRHLGLRPAEPSLIIVSTDCGAVSLRCPFGGFRLALGEPAPFPHTPQFARLCGEPAGEEKAVLAARILALTALELFESEEVLHSAARAFSERRQGE